MLHLLLRRLQKEIFLKTKRFEITVLPYKEAGLVAHYSFDSDLQDDTGNFNPGLVTGDRIDNQSGSIYFC